MNQADIPAPTPEDDFLPHQERIEYLIAQMGLVKPENLNDVQDKALARINLGLGTAATHAATDFEAAGSVAAEATARSTAITAAINAIVNGADAAHDTFGELQTMIASDETAAAAMLASIAARLVAVSHGSVAGTARPTSALPVLWVGTVAPTNAVARDLWMDETAVLLKRYSGSAWVVGSLVASTVIGARTKDAASTQAVFDSLPDSAYAPWLIAPPASVLAASGASAWYTANAATFLRFSLTKARTFRYVNLSVGTASGNIQVGVVKFRPGTVGPTGTDYIRVAHSGVIACPVAGNQQIDLGFFTLQPGEYGLFLWCDNTTAQFLHGLAAGITASRLCYSSTLSGGVGAAFSTTGITTRWVSGLTLEAGYLPMTALGDSITANDAAGAGTAGAWLANADEQTGYRFYPVTNNGVAGERSDQILNRAAAAFAGKRYATILAGTNDVGQNISAAAIISNLQSIYAAAVAAGLQGFAVLTIPPRMGADTVSPLTTSQAAVLKTVNAWIRANYTTYPGARLADIAWALSDGTDESAPLAANFADGIHPNATGSAVMTGIVKKAIRDWA